MESLDFTKPSQSPVYSPAAASAFFEAVGKVESMAAGKEFFRERQQRGFFNKDDRMYLLLAGTVALTVEGKSIDTVKAGEIFGEMASLTGSRRSATATAKTECRVIPLDGAQFQKAMQANPGFALMLMSIMIDRLRLTLARLAMKKTAPSGGASDERRVFDDATLHKISIKLGSPPLMRYSANQTIINAGEPGVLMYVPLEGAIAIHAGGKVLERVGPGGVFGEMALVEGSTRSASAVAETDCALMAVNRKQFLHLVQTYPDFGMSLLKVLAQRLQSATAQASK